MNTTAEIIQKLGQAYPDAHCELDYGTPYQLLVSVILSAQCTDKRVNVVTKELFAVGAVNAALFMNCKGPGLYDMSHLI